MIQLSAEEQQVLYLVKTDTAHANYFFSRVKSLKWFFVLKDQNYFRPEEIPFDSHANALFWNPIEYLVRVSEQLDQSPEYGKELIDIIDSIVKFSINTRQINNYHIWLYSLKILSNIPASIIKNNLSVESFKEWLFVWAKHSIARDFIASDVGRKLLPKFLQDDSTINYAESVIDTLTEIQATEKDTDSTFRDDAAFVGDSYWIREVFEKNSQLIGEKCSANTILNIADKLRKALEYSHQLSFFSFTSGNKVYRIEVSRVLEGGAAEREISFKDGYYECILKQYSEHQLFDVDRTDERGMFYQLHHIKPENTLYQFSFEAEDRSAFIQKALDGLQKSGINWNIGSDSGSDIGDLFDSLYMDYSQFWCKSLSAGPEYGDSPKEILTVALRDILSAKCTADPYSVSQILNNFLGDGFRFPIFRRITLFCIDKLWSEFSELLEKFFENNPTSLEESVFEVELQDIFEHHNINFNEPLKKRLEELINNVPEYYKEKGDEFIAYWKYKWLSPLRYNPYFSVLYEKSKIDANEEKPYEVRRSAFTGGFVEHKSPLSKEDLSQMTMTEIIEYLNTFENAGAARRVFGEEPDKEGLANVLRESVKENPTKFTDGLELFLKVDSLYLHRILEGLHEAWNSRKDIDWENFFDFSEKYFSRDRNDFFRRVLRDQGEDSGAGRYVWTIDSIVDIIADGCRDDKHAFDSRFFDKAEKIFELITPLLNGEKHPDTQRDALTYALNTTLGRTITAYISFSLRKKRFLKKKEGGWGQKKYEPFFAIGVEAYILFGSYLPQMKYLDEEYTKSTIDELSKTTPDNFEWQMFMEGYLSGSRVYPDVYSLMRNNYIKALESKTLQDTIEERLVEHIALGYLYYNESLDAINTNGQTSLFHKMLFESRNLDKNYRWLETVSFFSSFARTISRKENNGENQDSEEIHKKILEFWSWTFQKQEHIRSQLGEGYNAFVGRLAKFTVLLNTIDEEKESWLLLSAPYIDLEHGSGTFIEYLNRFNDSKSVNRIGRVFMKMLENTTPTFDEEDIVSIINKMYDNGNHTDANAICNTYGRRGYHFLRPLWEKYNNK